MLVSCTYCFGQHKRGSICPKRPSRTKETNYITKFRSSRTWQDKRTEIKNRDKYLCQICLLEGRYTFNKLEVHHIKSIANYWNGRLSNTNLITLCAACHKSAENGDIAAAKLKEIARKNEAALEAL